MTDKAKLRRLCGRSVRCAIIVIALVVCTTAFADPSKNVVLSARQQSAVTSPAKQKQLAQKTAKTVCYTTTTASRCPIMCSRLSAIPTTASPMDIFGHKPEKE